jgi:PAS domain S-box-containing protein
MQGSLNLRERLVILMLAAILPLIALSFWLALRDTRSLTEQAQSQLRLAASLVAANQEAAVESARQLLGAVDAPALLRAGSGECQRYFQRLLERFPAYANIGLTDREGQVLCDGRGARRSLSIGDRPYFLEALAARRLVMGEEIIGRSTGLRSIPFALPVLRDGQPDGVVFATLDLDRAERALSRLALPAGARVTVADRQGRVLMEHPRAPGRPVPRQVTQKAMVEAARTLSASVGDEPDQRGAARLFAIAASEPIGDHAFIVRVGFDRDSIVAASVERFRSALLVLLATLLLGGGAAWWIGGRVIVRPAREIVAAVRRLESGHLDARIRMPEERLRGEFAHIAAAFNLMASSLQRRQQDRDAELGLSHSAYAVLDLVLNSMQDALVAVNGDGQFLMFNEAATRLLPLRASPTPLAQWPQHFGLYHADGVHPFQPDELPVARALRGETGRQLQMMVRNALVPAGRLLQCSYQPVRAEGEISGALVVFADITALQRLQSEQALQFRQLRDTQLKLIEAQRVGQIGNWDVNLVTGRVWWSDQVYHLFGVDPESHTGTLNDLQALLHPDDRARHTAARDLAISKSRPMNVEYRIIRPDGQVAWMHDIAEMRRGGDGQPVWFGGVVQDITARKQAEADLVLLRKAVERLNDIVLISEANPDGGNSRIVFVNEAFERLTGFTAQEVIGKSPRMLQGPRTDAAALDRMSQALEHWTPVREELIAATRAGGDLCLEVDLVPLAVEPGRNTHWIAVARDISARKDAEQALVQSELVLQDFTAMLQRAAEAAQEINRQQSLQDTLQAVASRARHVIGARQATVTFVVDGDWAQPASASSLAAGRSDDTRELAAADRARLAARIGESGRPLRLTQQQLLAHALWREGVGVGAQPPLRGLLVVPLLARQGGQVGFLLLSDKETGEFDERDEYVALELSQLASIALDNARLFQQVLDFNVGLEARITERTLELSQQQARYQALADQAPEVVWNADVQGRVTYLNRAWYDLVGDQPDVGLGSGWRERVHPDDRPQMDARWARSQRSLTPLRGIRRVRARDGSYHTMSYRGAPVLDAQGQVVFWVGIDADITEFKAIEQALRSSNQELEAFSYSVSHDLRAPLGAIGGFNRALSHRLEGLDDERAHHFLARIQAGVERMEQLIDSLLGLAKVARAPLRYEEVDLGALAREALQGLQEAHPGRQVNVQIQPGLLAQGDARLLRAALENLLSNAWKFTSQRTDARIEVGCLPDSRVFFVRDNGVGFEMAYVDKLFGAFQRLHTEAEFPGTGIGLATVRRIMARHQGRVWAESQLGQGTSFYFVLSEAPPLAWLASDATPARPPA